ncbi:MAG: helix-turn-helix domain-containing protein [Devosia sp.]
MLPPLRRGDGHHPGQWLIEARTRHARLLLETTLLSIDEVASRSGFADASGLRDRFRRVFGVNPKRYRASFGTGRQAQAPPIDPQNASQRLIR